MINSGLNTDTPSSPERLILVLIILKTYVGRRLHRAQQSSETLTAGAMLIESTRLFAACVSVIAVLSVFITAVQAQPFTDVTSESGLIHTHSITAGSGRESLIIAAGGAVADHDLDGDPDIYLIGGSNNTNRLFRNNGDGTYTDISTGSGTDLYDVHGSGPVFADVNGDHQLDLLSFSIEQEIQKNGADPNLLNNRPRLFMNNSENQFTDSPELSGFDSGMPSYGAALGDLDRDGDLDMFMAHWSADQDGLQFFWQNNGDGQFSDVTNDYLGGNTDNVFRFSFTPNITDINNDGWPDVLLAADFGTSRVFMSNGVVNGQLTFSILDSPELTDQNGMGASVGDYDNDGDMDWFVTSIWDPDGIPAGNWGTTGNRLYRNIGNGKFEDVTEEAGVRQGYWGWGSCFADFNNDGHLDIYHENGIPFSSAPEFNQDPSRLFISNGDGTFTESSAASGLNFTGQGRGVSCMDYDIDGDLDILVMPNNDAIRLFRNELPHINHYLAVVLRDQSQNGYAVGSVIRVISTLGQQRREVTAGSNFASNNPYKQHFGLGADDSIQSLAITWPDGDEALINNLIGIDTTLYVSRSCHTQALIRVEHDLHQVTAPIALHHSNGLPMNDINVQLTIVSGPNAGYSTTITTDPNGQASKQINRQGYGIDRLRFQYPVGIDMGICETIVDWRSETPMFDDGFESLSDM